MESLYCKCESMFVCSSFFYIKTLKDERTVASLQDKYINTFQGARGSRSVKYSNT